MPDARLVVLPGAGHMVPLEAGEQLSAALADLVDRAVAPDPHAGGGRAAPGG